jgi:hypothetical protein
MQLTRALPFTCSIFDGYDPKFGVYLIKGDLLPYDSRPPCLASLAGRRQCIL